MPPNLLIETFQNARRVSVWMLLALLAVGLPLQAVSAAIAGMLGPRHTHRSTEAHRLTDDPMAGWSDFRRANYEHTAVARSDSKPGAQAHAYAHDIELRHHHAMEDASVVDQEAPADGDGAPAESPQVGTAFVMAANANDLEALPMAVIDDAWRTAAAQALTSPFPRRIERPPSHA